MQIVDGGMLAFAAYHAMKDKVRYPLAYQMPLTIRRIQSESDDTLAVCWDGENLWKRDFWPEYRQRPEIWEEANRFDFDSMFKVLNALGVVQFRQTGIEADEFIAALVHGLADSTPILIRSDDKDFMQLLSQTCWMHGRVRGVVRPEDVQRLLNVNVSQVVDLLALSGDKVDGIPPVASEAEALSLIHHHGHVRDWLSSTEPPPGTRRLLERARNQLETNLRLVDLSDTAVQLTLKPDVDGFGDLELAAKVGMELGIEHLKDESLHELLPAGISSMELLMSNGLVS